MRNTLACGSSHLLDGNDWSLLKKIERSNKTLACLLLYIHVNYYGLHIFVASGGVMVDFIHAISGLVNEIGNIGPLGVAVLALLVAFSAILILGRKE